MTTPGLDDVAREIRASLQLKQAMLDDIELQQRVLQCAQLLSEAFRGGHRLLVAGNGGSAADAQHIASEFVGQFSGDRAGLPAIALSTDSSILTSVGNDYGFARVFARQVETLGSGGDVLLAISTSGNSDNVLQALHSARQAGMRTIGFSGEGGGDMAPLCELCVCVPSGHTPRIQEAHILLAHTLCALVERDLFGCEINP